MNSDEIEQIRLAQADLQVAIGWHKLNVEPVEMIQNRMYDCLNRLHDLLKDNGVIMGRHMDAALAESQLEQNDVNNERAFLEGLEQAGVKVTHCNPGTVRVTYEPKRQTEEESRRKIREALIEAGKPQENYEY